MDQKQMFFFSWGVQKQTSNNAAKSINTAHLVGETENTQTLSLRGR